jgi:hypothetical protein
MLYDHVGGFVALNPTTAEGALTRWLADKRINIPVMPLRAIPLFDDPDNDPTSGDYKTEKVFFPILNFSQILISAPTVELYPDRLEFLSNGFELGGIAKDIREILKSPSELFKFEVNFDFGGTVSGTKVGVIIDLELKNVGGRAITANLGSMPFNIAFDGHLKVDTYAGDFSIKLMCKFAQWTMASDSVGFGFELGWKGMQFDTFKIYADFKVTVSIKGVNLTFSDFMLGVTDIAGESNPFKWTFTGATTISLAELSTYVPGLPSPFGDVALAAFADTTLELRMYKPYIKLSTTLKVIGIEVGYTEIELGMGIKYSNLILGMSDVDSWGMRAMRQMYLRTNVANLTLSAEGMTELSILNTYLGVSLSGSVNANINLWLGRLNYDIWGGLTMGLRPMSNGRLQFVLAGRADNRNTNNFLLTWGGGRGGGYHS